MKSIVEVPFYAETVQTVREGEAVWVVVKRVCESLGLAHAPQFEKLKAKQWACVTLIVTQDASGRDQEAFCLDLDSLPMWLATIEPSRVNPEARFKLVAYQKECARVLRDHFFRRAAAQPAASELAQIVGIVADLQKQVIELARRSSATVTRSEARSLAGRIVRAGAFQARTEGGKSRSHAQRIRMDVLSLAGWSGSGCRYENMPAELYPYAERALSQVERRLHERHAPVEKQGSLLELVKAAN